MTETRKIYLRNYKRSWMRNRRDSYFKDKVCVKCQSKENLELDHIIPEDKEHHAIWSWSEVRRTKELTKCQVLCKICHRLKTTEYIIIQQTGKPCPNRQLSNEDVIFARICMKAKIPERTIATILCIDRCSINKIRHNKFYADVQ